MACSIFYSQTTASSRSRRWRGSGTRPRSSRTSSSRPTTTPIGCSTAAHPRWRSSRSSSTRTRGSRDSTRSARPRTTTGSCASWTTSIAGEDTEFSRPIPAGSAATANTRRAAEAGGDSFQAALRRAAFLVIDKTTFTKLYGVKRANNLIKYKQFNLLRKDRYSQPQISHQ